MEAQKLKQQKIKAKEAEEARAKEKIGYKCKKIMKLHGCESKVVDLLKKN